MSTLLRTAGLALTVLLGLANGWSVVLLVLNLVHADAESPVGRPGLGAAVADYLYLAFTNATAFSPTNVLPLSRWAKLTMMVQSAVALAVAHAIDVLG